MRRCFLLFVAALSLAVAAPCVSAEPVPTQADVPYSTHPRQVLDFYQARTNRPAPLMFFVHGGGWMSGSKARPDFLDRCLNAGISVVSIHYRLIPDAMAEKVDPPVLACLQDAARALQFVRHKASEWQIDKTRIVGCGGSAGGFTSLWLAFHPDQADPRSSDPVARESTRLSGVLAFVPQTSLDPQQMRDWIPNNDYGHHAFALPSYQAFVDQRDRLMPWIERFSPYLLASAEDPPVCLFYDSAPQPGSSAKDPPHSANFGSGLTEKLQKLGVDVDFHYTGAPKVKYPDLFDFLRARLLPPP